MTQTADPQRAISLIEAGMLLRVGRSLGRTLYVQTSADASKEDLYIGSVDSPEIAQWIVDCVNEHQDHSGWHECKGRDDCTQCYPSYSYD